MSLAISITTTGRISSPSPTTDGRSPVGIVGSAALHAVVVGATLFTFAHKLEITQESPPVVPVDLVTIAQKTNLMAAVKVQPKIGPKVEEPAAVQPPKSEPPPQPQKNELRPPPQPEKSVPVPEPKPVEAPPPRAEALEPAPKPSPPPPHVKPAPEPKPEPQLETKPKTKPATAKKEEFDINNVMALLDKREAAQASAPKARTAEKNIKGFGPQTAMTMDLQDSLRSQIQQCWSPPVGAPRPEELVVEFDLFLKADGSVARPPQLSAESESAAAHDSFTRAAAEAARRAIYTCAPYKLPGDRYTQWQEITLNFDPRQMMDQ